MRGVWAKTLMTLSSMGKVWYGCVKLMVQALDTAELCHASSFISLIYRFFLTAIANHFEARIG
jgi:hypothetical protein